MREIITVQVGQAGNQVGCRFWELALREHAAYNKSGVYDEALSSFFRNVDCRREPPQTLPVGDGTTPIRTLKARAVLVDMEEGVLHDLLSGPLGDCFDSKQLLTDSSGSGNNWACGFCHYGPQYEEALRDKIRRPVEECDSLQSFLLLHSLGGGTGSGLGSYTLSLLEDEYPDVYRFTMSVFPSEDDDVVTSPYNSLLALARLREHADCVLPIDNGALIDICGAIEARSARAAVRKGSSASGVDGGAPEHAGRGGKPWDGMNGIAASVLLNMTSGARFEGALNVDLNEITMNLVPFPRMHFLLSSLAPLVAPADVAKLAATPRTIDQLFTDAFSREAQLLKADPRLGTYLACATLVRGDVTISDVNRNVARLRGSLRMPLWNAEGFKVGLCARPPVGVPHAVLALANNTCIRSTFSAMHDRFGRLRSRNFYLHHYTQYMEVAELDAAAAAVAELAEEYRALEAARGAGLQAAPPTRLQPLGAY